MPEPIWIVFFTVVFPPMFTKQVGYHGLFAVFLMLFPTLLGNMTDYLTVWFVFEAFCVASMMFKFGDHSFTPGGKL